MFLKDAICKMIRRKKQICKVYDASALRNYFDTFKETVETNPSWLIVIPEGVLHEISVAKSVDKLCRIIYDYITTNSKNSSNLIVEVAEDSIRSWSVDEQGIHVVEKYQKKGYDAELISCDKEQCFRAELKQVNCSLLPVNKQANLNKTVKTKGNIREVVKDKPNNFVNPQISLVSKFLNRERYLKVNRNLAIYDNRGKRRIGKDGYIKYENLDRIFYLDKEYVVTSIENNRIVIAPKV